MEAMKIFALSPPKEDLAELAEAIAIGLGGVFSRSVED